MECLTESILSINCFGDKKWHNLNGYPHRIDGPAIEYSSGGSMWFINGNLHRTDGGPAIDYGNGYMAWYVNGKCHREGGLPAVVRNNLYLFRDTLDARNEWWNNGNQMSNERGLAYMEFCQKMREKNRIRAQKKIYYWWIQICYDLEHKSGCGQRMAHLNLISYQELMK